MRAWLREVVVEGRFFPLLAVLGIMLFFAYPLALNAGQPGLLLTLFMVTMFFVSIRAIANNRRMLVLLVLLAVPMFAARLAIDMSDAVWIPVTHACISIAFFGVVMLVCLGRVVERGPVNEDKIIGAICVYLLLGLLFSYVYEIIYLLDPEAIDLGQVQPDLDARNFWVFTYFSYVTLTTLGYGDVLPVGLFARSMAALEAIVGPLYLAILIARLVSLADVRPAPRKRPPDNSGPADRS